MIEKFKSFKQYLAQIPQDKLGHAFYGALIYWAFSFINPHFALFMVLFVAVITEVFDKAGSGNPEYKDIIATLFLATLFYFKDTYTIISSWI